MPKKSKRKVAKKKVGKSDFSLPSPPSSDSDSGDDLLEAEIGDLAFDADKAISADPKVSKNDVRQFLLNSSQDSACGDGLGSLSSSQSDAASVFVLDSSGQSQHSHDAESVDSAEDSGASSDVEEAGPSWIYSESTKKKNLKWAKRGAKNMMWPARVLPDNEINVNPNISYEEMGEGKVVIEWLGTAERNIEILESTLVRPYGSPDSEATRKAIDQFESKVKSSKKRGQKSFRKDVWTDGKRLLERAYEQAEIRLKAFKESTKTPRKKQGKEGGSADADGASAQNIEQPKRKKRAYSEYVKVLPDIDVTLHVGDTIAYNDSSRAAGTKEARRITKIMQIFAKRKRPLELQNGGLIERDDYIQLSLRADGSVPPAPLRRNQALRKFKLARGEARLKALTKREELVAAARSIQGKVSQAMKDYANGKSFPEKSGEGGSSSRGARGKKKSPTGSRAKPKMKTKKGAVVGSAKKQKDKKKSTKKTAAAAVNARKSSKAGASASKKRVRTPGRKGKAASSNKKRRVR